MAVTPALEPPAEPSEEVQMKRELKELRRQLAQMQDSVLRLAEENHQLASALQSEQLEKKALARKLRELQEKLCEITALMALKSQEAQHLQQQGDQLLSQVWQHAESWQQLATEKEALCRRILLHRNLAMQLQHTEQEKMVALDRIRRQEMQEDLKASRLQEEQAAPLRVLALAGAGDMEQRPVEAPGSNTTIPEDSGSSEALGHCCGRAVEKAVPQTCPPKTGLDHSIGNLEAQSLVEVCMVRTARAGMPPHPTEAFLDSCSICEGSFPDPSRACISFLREGMLRRSVSSALDALLELHAPGSSADELLLDPQEHTEPREAEPQVRRTGPKSWTWWHRPMKAESRR
ncbi:golgin subfamily A member 2-like [Fukomys damarensis]|uniref:golgin subfamily A member 2-like n=1 Tax=Fukomys damarensis TaxID=885580 RepID=UPI0005400276|nr:golgin subfamily A member 2-like [Fukomys damarensis]